MDDWEKRYWNQKINQLKTKPEDLPHYEPVHLAQDKQRTQQSGNQWKEIDPVTAMYTNQAGLASRGMGPQMQTVLLREGAIFYRKIDAENFGSTVPMVRRCGPATGISGKEFEMRQECNCYLIDDLQVVDLGNIDHRKMVRLIEIRAPFVGTILVERNSIVSPGSQGPQVLKG